MQDLTPVRVATLNVWGFFADWPRRRELLAEQLRALNADVYCFQEVVRGAGGDQLAELADLLGYEWSARALAEKRPHENEEEGVAIVSRLQLFDIAATPLPVSDPPRTRLAATIELDGRQVRVVTFHAPTDARDEQIAALADLIDSPLLVAADLNAPPPVARPLLRNSFDDALGWDETPTWPADAAEFVAAWEEKLGVKPEGEPEARRVDYVLVRDLRVVASGRLAVASDHDLVWADIC